uniref:SLC14A1_1 protein n=1 Tax=Fopius arisanus TaxID=64838 RepID=A0A0C9RDT7_9HYME
MSSRSSESDESLKRNKKWAVFMGDISMMRDAISRRKMGKRHSIMWKFFGGIDAGVRGVGQVVFANNPVSGLLIVITLGLTAPNVLLFGSITGVLGLIISHIIQDPGSVIENGLTVYNPLLIGVVTSSLLPEKFSTFDGLTTLMMFTGTIFSPWTWCAVRGSLLRALGLQQSLIYFIPRWNFSRFKSSDCPLVVYCWNIHCTTPIHSQFFPLKDATLCLNNSVCSDPLSLYHGERRYGSRIS